MKRQFFLHLMLLLIMLFSIACSSKDMSGGLFLNNELNSSIQLFLDTTRTKNTTNYYQINIGQNRTGYLVTCIYSNTISPGSMYWFEYSEPDYYGSFITQSDTIEVFSCDRNLNGILKSTSIKRMKRINDVEKDIGKLKTVQYYVNQNRVEHLHRTNLYPEPRYYHLETIDTCYINQKLILFNSPSYFVTILPNMITYGTWRSASSSINNVELIPSQLFVYSAVRNDWVCEAVDGEKIKDYLPQRILQTSLYSQENNLLVPLSHDENPEFYWEKDQ